MKAEKAIFGLVPSAWLQNLLLVDGQTGWLEELLTFFHGTHFIAFLIVGFLIWLKDKTFFRFYKASFYTLLASGLSLYAIVPTAPPWMASEMFGLLPRIIHFNLEIYTAYIPDLTAGFNTDPVAAMPSLHAAFPFLCSLLLWKKFRWRAWPFFIYTAVIFFTIIYTGDHYFIDILAGVVLAGLSFQLANRFSKIKLVTSQHDSRGNRLGLNVKAIYAGVLIILISLATGHFIKPELKRYYSDYTHLKFPDFINYPEKADSNYLIALYLGDYYNNEKEINTALKYYEIAIRTAPTVFEKSRIEKKIGFLKMGNS
ncbi:MAG: phosphatase PAP2 family protein [Candidatus Saccharicenans sp.]